MSLQNLSWICFESRQPQLVERLVSEAGGRVIFAPAVKEKPVEENPEIWPIVGRLFNGGFDMFIFLTGVGTRYFRDLVTKRYPEERLREALSRLTTVARGPKPAAALREMNVPVKIQAGEPYTWREVVKAVEGRPEKRVAVQEYGISNERLLNALRERGFEVTPILVYRWELPDDVEPLRQAVRKIVNREVDGVLFTSSVQVYHLFKVASEQDSEEQLKDAMNRFVLVASIGPVTTEALNEFGIQPDFEPEHPKLAPFIRELAGKARELLSKKAEAGSR